MSGERDEIVIDRYWALVADGSRVVPETDPAGRWTHWIPGQRVPRTEAERLGAVEPMETVQIPAPKRRGRPPGSKNRPKPADKAIRPEENKGR